MKKILFLGLLSIGYAFAQNLIVYVVPEEVYATSTVMAQQYKQQEVSYNQQKSTLLKQIDQFQKNFGKPNQTQSSLDEQSQKLNELQDNYDVLNNQATQQLVKMKNDFMPYVKQATTELYKRNKYQYILSNSSIVITDPSNDISKDVAQLADQLYRDKQKL